MDFDSIYNCYFSKIYKFVYQLLGDNQQAEDITQEAFVKLHYSIRKNERIIDHKSWLYRVASNLCKNYMKRQHVFRRILSEKENMSSHIDNSLEDKVLHSEKIKMFRAVLKKLSIREQILLQLYKDGFSYNEMAQITKIKKNQIGTVLSRAIVKCSELINKEQL